MKKIGVILLGFLLILLLAYFSFLELSSKIKNDLLSKTEKKFVDKGIVGITASVEGEGLAFARVVTLQGSVFSEKTKQRIASHIESLEGIYAVKNQIAVEPPRYSVPAVVVVSPTKKVNAAAPIVPKALAIVKKESKVSPKEVIIQKEVTVVKQEHREDVEKSVTKESMVVQEVVVSVPSVPLAPQSVVKVPHAVKVTTVPTAIEATIAPLPTAENEKNKTEGVK